MDLVQQSGHELCRAVVKLNTNNNNNNNRNTNKFVYFIKCQWGLQGTMVDTVLIYPNELAQVATVQRYPRDVWGMRRAANNPEEKEVLVGFGAPSSAQKHLSGYQARGLAQRTSTYKTDAHVWRWTTWRSR